jgi:murein L,D-transpeptidase YcbB/YkuD
MYTSWYMNEFKFQLSTIVLVVLLAFGAYWAFTNLDTGVRYQRDDIVISEPETNLETTEVVVQNDNVTDVVVEQEQTDVLDLTPTPTLSQEQQELLAELEDLIVDDIYMREGSRGTRVGTVQNFLNLYLDTESVVDNQYGPGTRSRVRQFQEQEGLTADGLAGPSTYGAMIDVLESGRL